jgi:hypothetical protein
MRLGAILTLRSKASWFRGSGLGVFVGSSVGQEVRRIFGGAVWWKVGEW